MLKTEAEIADDAYLMESGIDPDSLLPDLLGFLERELASSQSPQPSVRVAVNQIKAELAVKKTHEC